MEIPRGYCHCGCGGRTSLARQSHTANGHIKGEPLKYIHGHGRRRSEPYVVTDTGYITPCWLYDGQPTRRYPVMASASGELGSAHRVFYERYKGPIPPGYYVDHLCRQTRCIRPDHLEAVTPAVNAQRSRRNKRWTEEAIAELIAQSEAGLSQAALARAYGVSQQTIHKTLKRAGATPSQRLGKRDRLDP